MGDITRNLSRHEFACSCGCSLADPHPLLVVGVQHIVDATQARAVIITSGSRCTKHNDNLVRRLGAGRKSQHLPQPNKGSYTTAADCIFKGVCIADALEEAQRTPQFSQGGIGLYLDARPDKVSRLHLDTRGYLARWGFVDGRKTTFRFALSELFRRI